VHQVLVLGPRHTYQKAGGVVTHGAVEAFLDGGEGAVEVLGDLAAPRTTGSHHHRLLDTVIKRLPKKEAAILVADIPGRLADGPLDRLNPRIGGCVGLIVQVPLQKVVRQIAMTEHEMADRDVVDRISDPAVCQRALELAKRPVNVSLPGSSESGLK
jgi:hypothetical protein